MRSTTPGFLGSSAGALLSQKVAGLGKRGIIDRTCRLEMVQRSLRAVPVGSLKRSRVPCLGIAFHVSVSFGSTLGCDSKLMARVPSSSDMLPERR